MNERYSVTLGEVKTSINAGLYGRLWIYDADIISEVKSLHVLEIDELWNSDTVNIHTKHSI